MIEGTIFKEYRNNAFLWWGVCTFFLTKFNSSLILNHIMQAIWIQQFYMWIIFPALLITAILLIYPIRRGFVQYVKVKENKKAGIIFILTLAMIFWLESLFFVIDVLQIMSIQIPQVVVDPAKLDYYLNVKDLLAFVALPMLTFLSLHNMKSELAKKGFSYNDGFIKDLKFYFSSVSSY